MVKRTRLVTARKIAGMSQEELAERSNLSVSAIQKMESGQRAITLENSKLFAKIFGFNSEYEFVDFTANENDDWQDIMDSIMVSYENLSDVIASLEKLFIPVCKDMCSDVISNIPGSEGLKQIRDAMLELKDKWQTCEMTDTSDYDKYKLNQHIAEQNMYAQEYNSQLFLYTIDAKTYSMNLSRLSVAYAFAAAMKAVMKCIIENDDNTFQSEMKKNHLDKYFVDIYEKLRNSSAEYYDSVFHCRPGDQQRYAIDLKAIDDFDLRNQIDELSDESIRSILQSKVPAECFKKVISDMSQEECKQTLYEMIK